MAGVVSEAVVDLAAEMDPAVDNANIASADKAPAPAEDTDVSAQLGTGDDGASDKAIEEVVASDKPTGDDATSDKPSGDDGASIRKIWNA